MKRIITITALVSLLLSGAAFADPVPRVVVGGWENPESARGFNPQPEPPAYRPGGLPSPGAGNGPITPGEPLLTSGNKHSFDFVGNTDLKISVTGEVTP